MGYPSRVRGVCRQYHDSRHSLSTALALPSSNPRTSLAAKPGGELHELLCCHNMRSPDPPGSTHTICRSSESVEVSPQRGLAVWRAVLRKTRVLNE